MWCGRVAFSPDGSRVAAGGMYYELAGAMVVERYAIHIWDAKDGRVLRLLDGHTDMVHGLAFSPDGRRLISGGFDRTVRLWEVDTGKQLRIVGRHGGLVEGVAFSPDGRRALSAGWEDRTVRLWDVEAGREILALPHPGET